MKKDIFNGKILSEWKSGVIISLILFAVIFIGGGLYFFLTAILDDGLEYVLRIFLYCSSALCIILGIGGPLLTLHLIRIYPEHRKFTKLFIQEYVFRGYSGFMDKDTHID